MRVAIGLPRLAGRGGVALAAGGATLLAPAAGRAPAAAATPFAINRCEALADMRIAPSAIGLPTGGAVVESAVRVAESARTVDKDGEPVLPIGTHCRVQGRIAPAGTHADPIRFNINLPLRWNGRALQSGGGGGGYVITAPGNEASGRIDPEPSYRPYRLTRGHVTFGSDEGHRPRVLERVVDPEALASSAGDFIKKTKDVALAVNRAAYGRAPDRLYLTGESAGGAEVMRAAQRFGGEYDGVAATSANISTLPAMLANNAIRSALVDGFLDQAATRRAPHATPTTACPTTACATGSSPVTSNAPSTWRNRAAPMVPLPRQARSPRAEWPLKCAGRNRATAGGRSAEGAWMPA